MAEGRVEGFRALLTPEGRTLLAGLPPYDRGAALSVGAALRREGFDETLVATALTQSRLRARAVPKAGDRAGLLFFTDEGLQQATRRAVAERHAQRYAGSDGPVLDLCCGVGLDLLALAGAGLRVTGVDRDPLTVEVARANLDVLGLSARADVRCADVTDVDLAGAAAVFIDPARRTARGRSFDPRSYSPSFDTVLGIAAGVPATGAKLAPGIPHAALPAGAEAEWVSDGGDVVECALWFGPLAGSPGRRATLLPSGATVTGEGSQRAPVGPVGRWLHEPDGAVIRSGLVAEVAEPLGATLVDPSIAYLTTRDEVATPFARSYEVTDVLPFGLKRLRALLRARGVGTLTVKTRGSAIEPEALRRQLRLRGDAAATVVLTRVAGAPTVLLVEPLPGHHS